jgi:hypothetical protein
MTYKYSILILAFPIRLEPQERSNSFSNRQNIKLKPQDSFQQPSSYSNPKVSYEHPSTKSKLKSSFSTSKRQIETEIIIGGDYYAVLHELRKRITG